jgi:hypothetical protein
MPSRTRSKTRRTPALTAATADKHVLYELAVQNPDAELHFVSTRYRKIRGRDLRVIREDFCGTGNSSCAWVRRHRENVAYGLDLHGPTLAWGRRNHVAPLTPDQASRVHLLRRNVLTPGDDVSHAQVVLAMNFSYWIFSTRESLRAYFQTVFRTMSSDGVFFLDHYGGWESVQVRTDRKRCKGFTYLWEQASFNPITHDATCRIHFEFRDGTALRNAFKYSWRLWTIPEIRELLFEAGFKSVDVFWEGDDDKGGGNGVFRLTKNPEPCPAHISFIVAAK